ncbi:MAG: hypothetical protein ABIP95_14475 [Pelobium sp.]
MMKELTEKEMKEIYFGDKECAKAIAIGGILGGVFGGAGALIGGAIAATGPDCLGWWD